VSVIVRTFNSADGLRERIEELRRQTVACEIVVVDSGSTDQTVAVARERADQVVTLPPGTYTPGRALNAGAAIATAPIHAALSSHCALPDDGWLDRALRNFAAPEVWAVGGSSKDPYGRPIATPWLQTLAEAGTAPDWGFSNHASCWRAEAWRAHPFDERLPTTEDRLFSWQILQDGHRVAFDPALLVDMSHRWKQGTINYYRRTRLEEAVITAMAQATMNGMAPYSAKDLVRDWWSGFSTDDHSRWFHRANPRRALGLLGKYQGRRRPYVL